MLEGTRQYEDTLDRLRIFADEQKFLIGVRLLTGTIDAVFDEGLPLWFDQALATGMKPVTLDEFAFKYLVDLGWRKYTIRSGRFKNLKTEYTCIDYSGWPRTKAYIDSILARPSFAKPIETDNRILGR